MNYARIINDVAADVSANPPATFAPAIASQFEPVPDEVGVQWVRLPMIVDEAIVVGQTSWHEPGTVVEQFVVESVTKYRYAKRVAPPPPPPQPPVPERVTARQAVEALIRIGVTEDAIEAALAAIPDATQRAIATNLWRRSNDFERSNPTLIALAKQSLGMTDDQLDQLFITASTL